MKPKGFYLSYSQINLYLNNPQQYYVQYILKHKPPPTRGMILGKIGHQAIADPKYDWRAAFRRERFLGAEERAMERILAKVKRPDMAEQEFFIENQAVCPLYGFIDGIDDDGTLYEHKFSLGGWNQMTVDDNFQISFYGYVYKLLYGRAPKKIILNHCNPTTGSVTSYTHPEMKRDDYRGVKNAIESAYTGIINQSWE